MKLLAGSVVRGNHQDASQGGLYLVDLDAQSVHQVVDWNDTQFQWQGRGRERGLRGIAFDGETIYCVASDELFAFSPSFELLGSWQNPYLKFCRGIAVYKRKLFITSSGFDTIVGFDLDTQEIDWALQILSPGTGIGAHPFNPMSDEGPIMLAKLDLRGLYCDGSGMYMTCNRGLLRFSGNAISTAVELPPGSHDAQPFRDGVLFNDSTDSVLRYAGRGEGEEDRALPVPHCSESDVENRDWCNDTLALAGFARGLCRISDTVVAGGSSPAAVTLYDLAANETLLTVRLSMDARSSIHGLEIWPY